MTIQEMLDQLADWQSQKDLLELQKQELINAVKIPAEVAQVQADGLKRKAAIDKELLQVYSNLAAEEEAQLSIVVVPPEIKAAFDAIEHQRAEIRNAIERERRQQYEAAQSRKGMIDNEFNAGVQEVYNQLAQRKADITAEFEDKSSGVLDNIAKLTADIKNAVREEGKSVKGQYWQAVYVKGRVTWNTDMLDGMIVAFPALEKARKCGEPSVTLRRI